MIEFLTSVSLEKFILFVLIWGLIGIATAANLYFSRSMPLSSKFLTTERYLLGDINKRAGWIIMETPVLISVIYFYCVSATEINASIVMVGVFIVHYFHRAIIYPYRIKVAGKRMPVTTVLSSMIFYIINGYLIGYYFGGLKAYTWEWLQDPRFIIGMLVFIVGFYINITSDNILIKLRNPGETGYKIPHGGFYKFISCPNYFGEILEWIGFAIMSWCLPAFIYMLWVALPLVAQAVQAHSWYRDTFKADYPQARKAVIPYIL